MVIMTLLNTDRTDQPVTEHEHAWLVESRHPTSTGQVLYVRCERCGSRRVDIQDHVEAPPRALSRPVRPLRDPVRSLALAPE